jgi:hypothetical protein
MHFICTRIDRANGGREDFGITRNVLLYLLGLSDIEAILSAIVKCGIKVSKRLDLRVHLLQDIHGNIVISVSPPIELL